MRTRRLLAIVGLGTSMVVACNVPLEHYHRPDADHPDAAPEDLTFAQQAYVKASNTGPDGFCNVALSADGSTLAVGAPAEDSAAKGIGSNQADNSAASAGAVYVFTRSGTTWAQQAYIKASNTDAEDAFGLRVALSADGSTLAVGAPDEKSATTMINGDQSDNTAQFAGAVYVFIRNGTTWNQQAYIKASNTNLGDSFGGSIALSSDGSTLAVAAAGESSAAIGIGGDQNDNSAGNSGAVYIYKRLGATWTEQAYIKASNTNMGDLFGESVALSGDGNTLVVGASGEASAATGVGGDQKDNSALGAGAVYVFIRNGMTWSQQTYVKASNSDKEDSFGWSVALSADGSTLAVGAPREDSAAFGINDLQTDNSALSAGAVYVFTRDGSAWSQQAYIKASNTEAMDFFGNRVALSGDGSIMAISANLEDSAVFGIDGLQTDNSAAESGAVYVFMRTGRAWSQQSYIKASNTNPGDQFGIDLALSSDGSTLAAGADGEGSAATGIDGNEADNSIFYAGAVYVYESSRIPGVK